MTDISDLADAVQRAQKTNMTDEDRAKVRAQIDLAETIYNLLASKAAENKAEIEAGALVTLDILRILSVVTAHVISNQTHTLEGALIAFTNIAGETLDTILKEYINKG